MAREISAIEAFMSASIPIRDTDRKCDSPKAPALKMSLEEIEFLLGFAASSEERREVAEYLAELTGHRVPTIKTLC